MFEIYFIAFALRSFIVQILFWFSIFVFHDLLCFNLR